MAMVRTNAKGERGVKRGNRYTVTVVGPPPTGLVERISSAHALAIRATDVDSVFLAESPPTRSTVRSRPATRAPGRSGVRARSPDDSPDDLPDDVASAKLRR